MLNKRTPFERSHIAIIDFNILKYSTCQSKRLSSQWEFCVAQTTQNTKKAYNVGWSYFTLVRP